jgi:hypothetical protein
VTSLSRSSKVRVAAHLDRLADGQGVPLVAAVGDVEGDPDDQQHQPRWTTAPP